MLSSGCPGALRGFCARAEPQGSAEQKQDEERADRKGPLLVSLQSTVKYKPSKDWTYAEIAARRREALLLLVDPMGHPAMARRFADHLRILSHHTLDTIDWNGGNSSF